MPLHGEGDPGGAWGGVVRSTCAYSGSEHKSTQWEGTEMCLVKLLWEANEMQNSVTFS